MAENQLGVQTRAMVDAKCKEGQTSNTQEQQPVPEATNNPTPAREYPTPNLDPRNPALNPVVELTSIETDNMMEYVRTSNNINLDWYVPDLMNTRIRDMIKNRLPTHTGRNYITVTCPMLKDFFGTSTFEIDLKSGRVSTFQTPPEDIRIPCQQEEFDLDLLRRHLQDDSDVLEHGMEELRRIPSIKRTVPAADIMNLTEIEEKVYQFCTLWELYVDASYELVRKSKLSPAEAAQACKIYGPYISDILQQVDMVMTIFAMENEIRNLKDRGHFPIPKITPHGIRMDNPQQAKNTLDAVEGELTQILKSIRESEEKYKKEKEEARLREQQARANKPAQRHGYNYLSPNSSTPIKNTDTRTGNQNRQTKGVHFNPNTIQHYYNMTRTTSHTGRYEPPANDLIIQAATTAPPGQLITNPTIRTGRNEVWRNNGANTQNHSNFLPRMTRTTGRNGLFNDSLNSSGNRNTPTCFRCGEQGHMQHECKNRVFCAHCRNNSHSKRTCRKLTNNTPSAPAI